MPPPHTRTHARAHARPPRTLYRLMTSAAMVALCDRRHSPRCRLEAYLVWMREGGGKGTTARDTQQVTPETPRESTAEGVTTTHVCTCACVCHYQARTSSTRVWKCLRCAAMPFSSSVRVSSVNSLVLRTPSSSPRSIASTASL